MQKFLDRAAIIFALLLGIVFSITSATALLLEAMDHDLLNAGTYKEALTRQQVYTRLPRILAGQLIVLINNNPCAVNPLQCQNIPTVFTDCARATLGSQRYTTLVSGYDMPTEAEFQQLQTCEDKVDPDLRFQQSEANAPNGFPVLFKTLNINNMESLISSVLPTDELQTITENLLDQTFAYADGKQNTIAISMVSLKQRIAGAAGLEATLQIIRNQPTCNVQLLATMLAELQSGNGSVILCSPPEEVLTTLAPLIQVTLKNASTQIPDSLIIYPPAGTNPTSPGPLGGGLPGWIRMARLIMLLSPCLPLLVLLFITLLVVRTVRDWLRWWGIPIFFSGMLSVGLAVTITFFFDLVWVASLANRIPPDLSPGVVGLGHDLAFAILQRLMVGVTYGGIFLVVLGLGMWVGSGFIKKVGHA